MAQRIDSEFERLAEGSQNKIERLAAKSCIWRVAKYWDSFLDTKNACQNIHPNDENTLQNMVETRKQRTVLQPNMKQASEVLPVAAALIGDALLTYAKYRNPNQ